MSLLKNLPLEYHCQDTRYYCGAACAQMVLAQIGAGLLDQGDLYQEIHRLSNVESRWATGPDGLIRTLNRRLPASWTKDFKLFELTDEESLSRRIAWTIEHHGIAPIALVYGHEHWVLVRGYEATGAPRSASDASYTITAFALYSPWSYKHNSPQAPHTTGDACGTGSMQEEANKQVPYSIWQKYYLTGVPKGHWAGKYLAVCVAEP